MLCHNCYRFNASRGFNHSDANSIIFFYSFSYRYFVLVYRLGGSEHTQSVHTIIWELVYWYGMELGKIFWWIWKRSVWDETNRWNSYLYKKSFSLNRIIDGKTSNWRLTNSKQFMVVEPLSISVLSKSVLPLPHFFSEYSSQIFLAQFLISTCLSDSFWIFL